MIKSGVNNKYILGLIICLIAINSCSTDSTWGFYYCKLKFTEPYIIRDTSNTTFIYNMDTPNKYVLQCNDDELQKLLEVVPDTIVNDLTKYKVKKRYSNNRYIVAIVARDSAIPDTSFDKRQNNYFVELCSPKIIKFYIHEKCYKEALQIIFSRCFTNNIPETIIKRNVSQNSPYYIVQETTDMVLSVPFCYWRDYDMVESIPIIINNADVDRNKTGVYLGAYPVYEDSSLIDNRYTLTLKRSLSDASAYYGELTANK